jgi:hypothetical protein
LVEEGSGCGEFCSFHANSYDKAIVIIGLKTIAGIVIFKLILKNIEFY